MMYANSTLASSNGTTTPLVLDYQKHGQTAVQTTVVTTGAGLTYNVEWTLDTAITPTSSTLTWFSSGSSALSSHSIFSFAFPIRSLRWNITAGTSNTQLTGTVIQSGA